MKSLFNNIFCFFINLRYKIPYKIVPLHLNYVLLHMHTDIIMKPLRIFFGILSGVLFFAQAQTIEEGEKLFKGNCAACHKVDVKEAVLVGPGLLKIRDRWQDKQELLKIWIKEPKKALATGDAYVKELWDMYPSEMPGQAVNDAEIDAILMYLDNPPVKKVAVSAVTTTEKDSDVDNNWLVMLVLSGVLLIVYLVARSLGTQLEELAAKKRGDKHTNLSIFEEICLFVHHQKTWVVILSVVLGLMGAVRGYLALMQIGVYPGYHPTQPINFPHDVHTSKDMAGIECVYCHNSVEKSKHAGIPSANVCMNCHKGIQEGRNTGKSEIEKIYKAVNFSPKTMQYGNPKDAEPIVWNKVHNLPDHVYFNHSQHVVVGKIACQKCHGPVETMQTVSQYSPLTMGWCIDCHRETEVPGYTDEKNKYYRELHARMDNKSLQKILEDDKVTVSELGGLECGKCHY